ncbi:UBN2_3 domain-containing protein [Cucumis melo var. makuwa]|uniref:UBN2_3 domain-containing protein n=1 Tax=Cucumis melo var. makuwa TaxID=1194695 RepID=A0A5A7U2B5_CUCMM|nr:UBN2_3 domain-containing protein [Cucumis melo var. makuwa]TYJ99864.1 UBN2_3 domain-containing protein [Cucumis melo var. makuwa]
MLKAHKLFVFIDGSNTALAVRIAVQATTSDKPSSSTSTTSMVANPLYDDWITKDQALTTLINATLSPKALAYIFGSNSSYDVWTTLKKHHSSNSQSNIIKLKTDL